LYKVRDFKVEDSSLHGVSVGWMGTAQDSELPKEDDGDTVMVGGEGDYKTATVFPTGSMSGIVKLLTFFRKGPFDVKAQYVNEAVLMPNTVKDLGNYRIELPPQTENKKIKVKAKMTLHGTFTIESAQMVEVEEYDETVKEKRELPPDPVEEEAKPEEGDAMKTDGEAADAMKTDGDGDAMKTDGDAAEAKTDADEPMAEGEDKPAEAPKAEAKKEPEKKYEWVEVIKKKKRTKRTDLNVVVTGTPGIPEATLQKLQDAETAMVSEMKEIIDTDAKRNDLEGYIFTTRDKVSETGELGPFISSKDREQFSSDLMKAEDWLYDNEGATKAQYIEKLEELKEFGNPVMWRFKEDSIRAEWVQAVAGTISNYRAAAENPGDKYGHIAADKLTKISAACAELDTWLTEKKTAQGNLPKTEKPVLVCADMEKRNQDLAKLADEILKEPKPAPPKEEKKVEEKKEEEAPKDEAAEPEPSPMASPEGENVDGPENMDVD
jgi:heat shock protein 4